MGEILLFQQAMPPAPNTTTTAANAMFDLGARSDRPAPQMPSALNDNIEYPRAASWSSSTVAEIMRDPLGRQVMGRHKIVLYCYFYIVILYWVKVFRCFLYEALAEENLLFVEDVEKLKKEKDAIKLRDGILELLDKYGQYVNLSSVAMQVRK